MKSAAKPSCAGAKRRNVRVLEAALDAIITLDHEGRIEEFNPAAERIFGWPRYETLGQNFAEKLLSPASRAEHARQMQAYLNTGNGGFLDRRAEVVGQRADGGVFPLELGFARVPTSGQPRFTAYARDLSDRQREQAAHAQLEREHAALQARSRTLAALVPTCAACQHIRLPDGAWGELETHLRQQGPAPAAELLCPACEQKQHPGRGEKKFFRLWSKEV